MPLAFRNLAVSPDDPVSAWPTEAVQAALERGDLGHWQRIVAELRRDPWGPIARQVEEVLSHSRPYGIADAMTAALSHARSGAESAERAEVAAEVRDLIEGSGLGRAEFARRIGTSASRLSTYATGKVTPSAALMIRIRRVASRRISASAVSRRVRGGEVIGRARRMAGLSRAELAAGLGGRSAEQLARWEDGVEEPTFLEVDEAVRATGVE
ncbi:MAG: helix-turn-helix domain-containing protein, partial [Pseudonocardia sp.]|nr:helix-turn-helix domain-containing protein [Pseudonocardia sp.]